MKSIKLLDCTLRDGGYYNRWDFSDNLISDYLNCMRDCSVDYVELGFRTLKTVGFMGPCAYTKDEFINVIINSVFCNYKRKLYNITFRSILPVDELHIQCNEDKNDFKPLYFYY